MDQDEIRKVLEDVASGRDTVDGAVLRLKTEQTTTAASARGSRRSYSAPARPPSR